MCFIGSIEEYKYAYNYTENRGLTNQKTNPNFKTSKRLGSFLHKRFCMEEDLG